MCSYRLKLCLKQGRDSVKLRTIILLLLFLPFAEMSFFGVVSTRLSWLGAFLLLLGTSFAGIYLLKFLGGRLLQAIKRNETVEFSSTAARNGLLSGIGALLLAFPGFLTDIAGLICLMPLLLSTLKGESATTPVKSRSKDGIIELSPNDWRETVEPPPPAEELTPPKRKRKPKQINL
jgi:UPF0716 protein FxsA